MTRLSCPPCRLRFTSSAASPPGTCPECGRHLQSVPSAEAVLGYRLFVVSDAPALPVAAEMALPIDVHGPDLP
jgi:hypothetical protein